MALSKELMYKINENTRKSTYFYDIAEQYGLFKRLETQVKVDLEEINFYGGYRVPRDEFTFSSSVGKAAMNSQRRSLVRNHIDLTELFSSFAYGHICFVGPAGIGKTTLMKSIAQDVLEEKFESLREVDLVHFVQCRQYKPGDFITVGDFLFGGSGLATSEVLMAIKFALEHPNRILFILDSLDTLRYNADGVYKQIAIYEKAGPEAVLWNFLSGKLLHGSRIITSSREHSIRNYIGSVQPERVITLLGFSKESIKQVIMGYVGEAECLKIMQRMEEKMPDMVALCNIPVILVFTLIGLKADSDLEPTTMTRIMVIVLQSMIRSPFTIHQDILDALYKLERLSHIGNIERRVLFFSDDFKKVGLEPEEAADLAIVAPGGFTQRLVQGENALFFAHQMFQEMLGSLWIVGNSFIKLKEFFEARANLRPYAVIRRFLYGILLDREVHEVLCSQELLPDDEDYEKKFEFVRKNLRAVLEGDPDDHDFLEVLIAINEAKQSVDDIIQSSIHEVSLLDMPLSPSDVFAIGSVISRKDTITNLDLCNCSLDSHSMQILASTLKGSNLKIFRFILGENTQLGVDGMASAGQIATQCDTHDLILSSCNLSGKDVQALAGTLKNKEKFVKLFLNCNENMGVEGLSAAGTIITQCNGKELDISKCNLSWKQLEAFAKATNNAHGFRSLHLSDNTKLGVEGMAIAGNIVTERHCEQLQLCVCRLSTEQLHVLAKSVKEADMLQIVNLSEYKSASHGDIVALSNLIPSIKGKLQLHRWKIKDDDRRLLQEELNAMEEKSLQVYLGDGTVLAAVTPTTELDVLRSPADLQTTPENTLAAANEKLSAELSRCMKRKSIKGAMICPKGGGSIENMGWKVTFVESAFENNTFVETSVTTDFTDRPPACVPVSSIFECTAGRSLKAPADLEARSYLIPQADGIFVKVFRKEDRDSEWQFYKKAVVGEDGKICFSTNHFTLFQVVAEYASWIWTNVKRPFVEVALENLLYIGSVDFNIACIACLNQTKLVEDTAAALRTSGYSPLLPVPVSIVTTRGAVLQITARCIRPRNLELILDGDEEGADQVDRIAVKELAVQEILDRSKAEHYFPIRLRDGDLRHSNHALRIKLTIKTGDHEVSHTVSKDWPIHNIVTQHNYYGDIKANKVVMPTGNLVEKGVNERNVFEVRQ